MRAIVLIMLAVVIGSGAFFTVRWLTAAPPEPVDPFTFVIDGDVAALRTHVEMEETHVSEFINDEGLTMLEVAFRHDVPAMRTYLLSEVSEPAALRFADGSTLLHLTAEYGTAPDVWFALQAAVDPRVTRTNGDTALTLAQQNPNVRNDAVVARLAEFTEHPWVAGWPAGYQVPIPEATISSRRSHLPGARRAYRNGRHEGFDFYSGTISVAIGYGTPIIAVSGGEVIRADHDYVELTEAEYDAIIAEAVQLGDTSTDGLDKLRGRQVWVLHPGGFISRYAHLAAVSPTVTVGNTVNAGDVVGTTGNSGTIEAVWGTEDDPHPHVEIWQQQGTYLGDGLTPEQIWPLAGQVFGQRALPPYTD